jgi:hypothetical protein
VFNLLNGSTNSDESTRHRFSSFSSFVTANRSMCS